MSAPAQKPGCLPRGYTLDSLLTPEQFAVWRQIEPSTARLQIRARLFPVVRHSRESIRIHPRTFLERSLK